MIHCQNRIVFRRTCINPLDRNLHKYHIHYEDFPIWDDRKPYTMLWPWHMCPNQLKIHVTFCFRISEYLKLQWLNVFFSSKTYGWSSPYIPNLVPCPDSDAHRFTKTWKGIPWNAMDHGGCSASILVYPVTPSIPSYVPCLNLTTAFRFTAPWKSGHNKVTISWRAAASSVASARTSAPIFWIWSLLVKSLWRGEIVVLATDGLRAMRNTWWNHSRSIHSDFLTLVHWSTLGSWAWHR